MTPPTAFVLVGFVATLLALGGVLWKLVRFLARVERVFPTLEKIADEFRPNSGESLRDAIDRIEESAVAAAGDAKAAAVVATDRADNAASMAAALAKQVQDAHDLVVIVKDRLDREQR